MYEKENRGLFFDCVCYIGNRIMVKGRVNVQCQCVQARDVRTPTFRVRVHMIPSTDPRVHVRTDWLPDH